MQAKAIALVAFVAALSAPASAQFSTAGLQTPSQQPFGVPAIAGTQPCSVIDDGITDNALGLTAGGWLCHIQYVDCLAFISEVQSAYGSLMFPGGVSNGRPTKIAVWEDTSPDTDPTGGLVLRFTMNTVVTNASTDILNPYPVNPAASVNSSAWIGAAVQHPATEFPAPMDTTNPTPRAWVFWSGGATIDMMNPNNNSGPPQSMTNLGFPAAFLLRADGSQTAPALGTPYCFGDGSASACPCGNESAPGAGQGCLNGSGQGAVASASGSTSVAADDLVFHGDNLLPSQPALLFVGLNAVNGGNGTTFGDGLRCAGGSVIRLGVEFPNATGDATWGPGLGPIGGWGSGDTRRFQVWYRNPGTSPCGSNFNLSNGYEISFTL